MTINLKTPTGRKKLPAYREPHWIPLPSELVKGGSLGFRRSPESGSESWHARAYVKGEYLRKNLGTVTDTFQYKEAFNEALAWVIDRKTSEPVKAKSYTLDDILQIYLTYLQGNSSPRLMDTRRQAEKRLYALVPAKYLKRDIETLDSGDINEIQRLYRQRTNLQGKPISNDSVNRVMVHLVASINYGYRDKKIETKEALRGYKRLKEEDEKRRSKNWIPLEDRQAFIAACPAPLKAFVSALNYLAARPSEIRRLRVSDVTEKGVRLVTYKGNGSTRTIPLGEDSAARKLFDAQTKGKEPDDFVFLTKFRKQWTQANLSKAHNIVRDTGKFSQDFESYVWRHCRITDWSRAGFPAPEVANMAGTSLEFIQKNYFSSHEEVQTAMVGM